MDPQTMALEPNFPRNTTPESISEGVCPVCGGVEYIFLRNENGELVSRDCKCAAAARSWRWLTRSGLAGLAQRYTFEGYQTGEPWQKAAKDAALRFLEDGRGKWFFIGGTSGAGKTHLCTALSVRLIEAGIPLRYIQWRSDIPPIKAAVNDAERYEAAMEPLKQVRALYIDDFWKGSVTEGDKNIAFDLLNCRYIDSRKITILSSELTLEKIIGVDAAAGGRIRERAGEFVLNIKGNRNWRLRG